MASNCRRDRRCLVYCGKHALEECHKSKTLKEDQVKSLNCNGNHAVNSKEYPVFMEKKAL